MIYTRDATSHVESVIMGRTETGWTDPDDAAYVFDGTDWIQFQPGVLGDFIGPENLAAATDSTAASFSWTDPSQDTVPTHVQWRVPELTPVYTEYPYGTVSASIAQLTPATEYQVQVRYVIRSTEDGAITDTSSVTNLFFTTDAADQPSLPAPDPGGTGPDSIVTFPPIGGTGTPGEVCTWEYVLQYPEAPAEFVVVWLDSASTATGIASGAEVNIDFIAEGFLCGDLVRWKFREVCDAVPLDWQYSDAFFVPCDWDLPCGGMLTNAAFSATPWTDAICLLPDMCINDELGQHVRDAAGGQTFGKLEAWLGPYHDGSNWRMLSKTAIPDTGAPLLAGYCAGLAPIGLGDDISFSVGLSLSEQPTALATGTLILHVGELLRVYVTQSGAGYRANVLIPCDGTDVTLTSASVFALDDDIDITVVIDETLGTKTLYVNGAVEATNVVGTAVELDVLNSTVKVYAVPSSRTFKIGIWDRVLTLEELDTFVPRTVPFVKLTEAVWTGALTLNEGWTATTTIVPAVGDFVLVTWLGTTSMEMDAASKVQWNSYQGGLVVADGQSRGRRGAWWCIWEAGFTMPTFDTHPVQTVSEYVVTTFGNVDPSDPFPLAESRAGDFTEITTSIFNAKAIRRIFGNVDTSTARTSTFVWGWMKTSRTPAPKAATTGILDPALWTDDSVAAVGSSLYQWMLGGEDDHDLNQVTNGTAVPSFEGTGSDTVFVGSFCLQAPRTAAELTRPTIVGAINGQSNFEFALNTRTVDTYLVESGDLMVMYVNGATTFTSYGSWTALEAGSVAAHYTVAWVYDGSNANLADHGLSMGGSSMYRTMLIVRNASIVPAVAAELGSYSEISPYPDSIPAGSGQSPTLGISVTPTAVGEMLLQFYKVGLSVPTVVTENGWGLGLASYQTVGGADGTMMSFAQIAADTGDSVAPEVDNGTNYYWAAVVLSLEP